MREELSYIEMLPHLIITTAGEPELKPKQKKTTAFLPEIFYDTGVREKENGNRWHFGERKKTNKFSTNYECIYGRKK